MNSNPQTPDARQLPRTTDVLIVGAGPTGLTAALALRARGVRATVIDNQTEGANTSRAAVVHSRTLEVLEPLGVSEALVARGIQAARFTIRDRDRVLFPVQFERLPTAYPYTLMVSQAVTEQVLLARLRALGGEVWRPHQLASVTQDAEGATATLQGGATIRARFVVGADGMHSRVREGAGIPFQGKSYDDSFLLADVKLDGAFSAQEVLLYFSPDGLVVVAPLPGGIHRVVATALQAPSQPSVADVQALLDKRGPRRERAVVREVVWGSRFRVQHRLADRFVAGRIALAGDAAHVHSPAGGQGMNTGIQDGAAVAEAIAAALSAENLAPLAAYQTQRRAVAQRVVGLADRLTRLATMGASLRAPRNLLLRALAHVPAFRRRMALQLSGLVFRPA
jgi:2-polyprenyl-6-methoxyphenol hydroxylase-like FAD-dependent oxidoreductase